MDPAEFLEGVNLELALPNYARLNTMPFADLHVTLEYWVVDSQTMVGRITLLNRGVSAEAHRLRLHGLLRPDDKGESMMVKDFAGAEVLLGRTGDIQPLLFLSGGALAERVAYPAMSIRHQLLPGEPMEVFWGTTAQAQASDGFQALRSLAGSRWDAEVARLEMINRGMLQVETGDPEWNAAFARSQQVALGLAVSGTTFLPDPTFVMTRSPDQGFSAKRDGRDLPESWGGQDVFAAVQLADQLMPSAPELIQGWLRNYLHVQGANGGVDGRPGLAGGRMGYQAPPLLASMAWHVFQRDGAEGWLREAYPALKEFYLAWFQPKRDRDSDGVPEWEIELQSGFPESPTFSRWAEYGENVDISTLESPDLIGYLVMEARSLMSIASYLGRTEDLPDLETHATMLRRGLDKAWSPELGLYTPVDRDLHVASKGKRLGRGAGTFTIKVERKFDPMVRLVIRCRGPEDTRNDLAVTIHGRGPGGQFRKERLEGRDFRWFWTHGNATTANTFGSIDRIEISSPNDKLKSEVHIVEHQRPDSSWLLPLGTQGTQKERDEQMADVLLTERFWRPHGIPSIPMGDPVYGDEEHLGAWAVRPGWNGRLGAGLLALGRREEAAELVKRVMEAITEVLALEGRFRTYYHPEEIGGGGDRDSAFGLAPLDLFLRVLGVSLRTPWSLEVEGENPYQWPVTLRWRGLVVHRPAEGAGWIQLPDGERVDIEGTELTRIERVR